MIREEREGDRAAVRAVEVTNQWGVEGPEWLIRGEAAPGEVRYPAAFGP